MNLMWILFSSWFVFWLVEGNTSLKELELYGDHYDAPLAVIKKYDSSKLQLAIPHQRENKNTYFVVYYIRESEDENSPKEKLMVACPAFSSHEKRLQYNWSNYQKTSTYESKLFFLSEYQERNMTCESVLIPSIQKVGRKVKYCRKSHSELYEVGYPVSNDDEATDIQFLPMYKICYSKREGKGTTKYSIHRIESPSLLLQNLIKELSDLIPITGSYGSILERSMSNKDSFQSEKYYAYQFVGIDDIPVPAWQRTIYFLFNYTLITKDEDIFKGMIRADHYIRLYSKKNKKPLTLYSGTYQKKIFLEYQTSCLSLGLSCNPTTTILDSFWRIIVDDDNNAVFLATQHTQEECNDETYLCKLDRKVKHYEDGGCTYICSLNEHDKIFEQLDLPSLEIKGYLDFTIETDETETKSAEGSSSFSTTSSIPSKKKTDIIDFLNSVTLAAAFTNADADIAKNLHFESTPADHDGTDAGHNG